MALCFTSRNTTLCLLLTPPNQASNYKQARKNQAKHNPRVTRLAALFFLFFKQQVIPYLCIFEFVLIHLSLSTWIRSLLIQTANLLALQTLSGGQRFTVSRKKSSPAAPLTQKLFYPYQSSQSELN